ncbi:hypothetical protein DEO72_LG1g2086 [Vigna unguiculata]|uniref:Uncharacterized protein n=1 Tax=Vigna unguiculata TaxID=3917 RepID=A0A4D6KPL7_VIGUN|nr:hypothetical protein DEO72_LG1g2086 [Vigna unguiculata]
MATTMSVMFYVFYEYSKGYVLSHNSRNTSKPTFEVSKKPCRPRKQIPARTDHSIATRSLGTVHEAPSATASKIAWHGTCIAKRKRASNAHACSYRLARHSSPLGATRSNSHWFRNYRLAAPKLLPCDTSV